MIVRKHFPKGKVSLTIQNDKVYLITRERTYATSKYALKYRSVCTELTRKQAMALGLMLINEGEQ